ncbi:hypothetical protein QUW13_05795 [Enterococcus hirae]|nr:hypothetical protein [Enterococcus hirae]
MNLNVKKIIFPLLALLLLLSIFSFNQIAFSKESEISAIQSK